MIALDTNLIVRVAARDDEKQLQAALEVLGQPRLWLAKTVLLETEWVLRYTYELDRGTIAETFKRFLGYPNITFEDRRSVLRAVAWYDGGMDFADALHLASSDAAERFVTFDRTFATKAKALRTAPPVDRL